MVLLRVLPVALSAAVALAAAVVPSHARVRLGVEGGFRYGDVSGDDLFGAGHGRPAWSVGVVVDAPVGAGLSLVTGARYLAHHDDYGIEIRSTVFGDPAVEVFTIDTETTLHYVTLPVRLAARPAGGLVLEGGADAGYLLDARSEVRFDGGFDGEPLPLRAPLQFAQIFEGLGTLDDDDRYRRWNVGLTAGAGWDFRSAERVLTLRLRYEHGLTRLHPNQDLGRRTRALALDAGMRW